MPDVMMTAPFQNIHMPQNIRVNIRHRVLDGVTHARLCRQVDHPLKFLCGEQLTDSRFLRQIHFKKLKLRMR